jgi:hypothetical protein
MPDDSSTRPRRKIDDATYAPRPEWWGGRMLLRAKRWLVLDADRWLVAACLSVGVFVSVVVAGTFGPTSVESFLTAGVRPGTALVELMKTIVSVVVIVLSINQLVLSPGLGPVGDQRERYGESVDLRRAMESHTGVRVSPSSPARFLAVLLDEIRSQASHLGVAAEDADPTVRAEIESFVDAVTSEARAAGDELSSAEFGSFAVVSAALRFAITDKVRGLHALRRRHEDAMSAETAAALEELDELLELFTVSREYLKTVYIRSEYVSLSEGLLYTGLPALVVTYCAAQIYHPGIFPGDVVGVQARLLFVAGAVTVSLVPFVYLIAAVFRLAAMSRSTLFVGPFDAHTTEEEDARPARSSSARPELPSNRGRGRGQRGSAEEG